MFIIRFSVAANKKSSEFPRSSVKLYNIRDNDISRNGVESFNPTEISNPTNQLLTMGINPQGCQRQLSFQLACTWKERNSDCKHSGIRVRLFSIYSTFLNELH